MKIAIIGSGIAGNVAAYMLKKEHDITVFETNGYTGGHSHTHDIEVEGQPVTVDTGFIVFNYRTYPHFTKLLSELGVAVQPSSMSFSVKCDKTGLEYNGTTLNSLFAQRRNLFRPKFYRMIRDILRFNKEAIENPDIGDEQLTLSELLARSKYSREFIDHYLIPMGAAIWSAHPDQMMQFPAGFFIRFFHNHGMLSVDERPMWYTIKGGSREYVKKLSASYFENIRHHTTVKGINRFHDRVCLTLSDNSTEEYDQVFIATHSDQALNLLNDASHLEREILSAIPYQNNEVILHTDKNMLPDNRLAWAAWNYHILKNQTDRVALTYNMNILQKINSRDPVCVTLNNESEIDPKKIIKRIQYQHPVFTPEGIQAQQRQAHINGQNRTYFCGAYWRYGFHEDGVVSAINAINHFEEKRSEQLYLRRAS